MDSNLREKYRVDRDETLASLQAKKTCTSGTSVKNESRITKSMVRSTFESSAHSATTDLSGEEVVLGSRSTSVGA